MSPTSYSDVFQIAPERFDDDIQPGDLVRTGPNLFPHYTVIAIHGETAWLRNVQNGADGLTAVHRCRKINGAPPLASI